MWRSHSITDSADRGQSTCKKERSWRTISQQEEWSCTWEQLGRVRECAAWHGDHELGVGLGEAGRRLGSALRWRRKRGFYETSLTLQSTCFVATCVGEMRNNKYQRIVFQKFRNHK
eukprot:3368588-Pleurochrysis_carterae.AAC.4